MERYFAYGSNMSSGQMSERCPGARALGPARLAGFALTFNRWSDRRRSYVADVIPVHGSDVWGVLWDVTPEDLASLDRFEGVAIGAYRRDTLRVASSEPPLVDAVTYRVCQPQPPGPPSPEYLALLIRGAYEHGLPGDYLQRLKGVLPVLGSRSSEKLDFPGP
jgi:cation transport regulator ChaC